MAYASLKEVQPEIRLLVLVPTLALLDQWAVALQCDLGLRPDQIATYSGEGKPHEPGIANVAVLNSARELTERLTSQGHWMLVVDECHRAGSPANSKALRGRFVAALGLSATPYREFDDGFASRVAPVIGGVFYEYDYDAARRDGVIADFDIANFEIPLTDAEHNQYHKLTQQIAREFQRPKGAIEGVTEDRLRRLQLRRAAVSNSATWRVPAAVAVARRYDGKMLVFHERISAADAIASHLDRVGRRVERYHSGIYGPRRREGLRRFRVGIADTLVTCRSLDEGLNVPDASVALIAASTRSKRQRIQRLGRVLRATSPDKRAVVATLYATMVERTELEKEEARLEGVAEVRWFAAEVGAQ